MERHSLEKPFDWSVTMHLTFCDVGSFIQHCAVICEYDIGHASTEHSYQGASLVCEPPRGQNIFSNAKPTAKSPTSIYWRTGRFNDDALSISISDLTRRSFKFQRTSLITTHLPRSTFSIPPLSPQHPLPYTVSMGRTPAEIAYDLSLPYPMLWLNICLDCVRYLSVKY